MQFYIGLLTKQVLIGKNQITLLANHIFWIQNAEPALKNFFYKRDKHAVTHSFKAIFL